MWCKMEPSSSQLRMPDHVLLAKSTGISPYGQQQSQHSKYHNVFMAFDAGFDGKHGPPGVLWQGEDTYRRRRFDDVGGEDDQQALNYSNNTNSQSYYNNTRTRRMSLLQTLRHQNRQMTDSGLYSDATPDDPPYEKRTDDRYWQARTIEKGNNGYGDTRTSSRTAMRKTPFASLKQKTRSFFAGKKSKATQSCYFAEDFLQSVNQAENDRRNVRAIDEKNLPKNSVADDSGHGSRRTSTRATTAEVSPPHEETIAIIETRASPPLPIGAVEWTTKTACHRSNSCPDFTGQFTVYSTPSRAISTYPNENKLNDDWPLPLSKARRQLTEYFIRPNFIGPPRSWEKKGQSPDEVNNNIKVRSRLNCEILPHPNNKGRFKVENDAMTCEDYISEEENSSSTVLLDHYLALDKGFDRNKEDGEDFSSSQASNSGHSSGDDFCSEQRAQHQVDGRRLNLGAKLGRRLAVLKIVKENGKRETNPGMNILAKHYFEFQSFMNLPHRAVQLHKTPVQQAGVDPSAGWAPKSMHKAGKNQAAPGARPNRHNQDTRPAAHRHGRAGKHEFREWGDRHGELRQEKIAPHKDAWSRFLGSEDAHRTVLESEFEDRILAAEPETLPERISRSNTDEMQYTMGSKKEPDKTEILLILTYASSVQFVTATVKKAKCLPFNNDPFARVMLFEGRRLLEQKQTTITTSATSHHLKHSDSASCSSASSSSGGGGVVNVRCNDAIFSESFLFHVSPEKLDRCHLVIELFDRDLTANCVFSIGHCVVGSHCGAGGNQHWHQMLRKCGFPVCMWHRIAR